MNGEFSEAVESVGEIAPRLRVLVRITRGQNGVAVLSEHWHPERPPVLLGVRRQRYESTRQRVIRDAIQCWGDLEVSE